MNLPTLPPHSRWEILEEIAPEIKKRQSERTFHVRCTCGSGIEKILAYRYVKGESLSCGCLVREKAAEMGRSRIDSLNIGYGEWLKTKPKKPYGPKLPSTEELIKLRAEGLTCQQIADQYEASAAAVSKRLRPGREKRY
ncbi:MAG: hypothetical protein MH252_07590 [Thermosynechococcaceae cyanobacterium MS004]|nr:hypothetical protein [Thermosynechococcaceae cyanobacterium MS004]